jgi:hypothetical protein
VGFSGREERGASDLGDKLRVDLACDLKDVVLKPPTLLVFGQRVEVTPAHVSHKVSGIAPARRLLVEIL